jgi:cation transporter-like permease
VDKKQKSLIAVLVFSLVVAIILAWGLTVVGSLVNSVFGMFGDFFGFIVLVLLSMGAFLLLYLIMHMKGLHLFGRY